MAGRCFVCSQFFVATVPSSKFFSYLGTSSCRCGVDLGLPTWPSDPANYQVSYGKLTCSKTLSFLGKDGFEDVLGILWHPSWSSWGLFLGALFFLNKKDLGPLQAPHWPRGPPSRCARPPLPPPVFSYAQIGRANMVKSNKETNTDAKNTKTKTFSSHAIDKHDKILME